MATAPKATGPLTITELNAETITFTIVGRTPLIINKLSNKAKHELLLPRGRKTTAEKALSLKHDPVQEFLDSVYVDRDPDSPTLLVMPATTIKKAMGLAAMRSDSGAKLTKAKFLQLSWAEGVNFSVYGIPKLFMAIARTADVPDVRTRAIVEEWCAEVTMTFLKPELHAKAMLQLAQNAGLLSGIGDWRPEKGSGTYGQFSVAMADDPRVQYLRANCGRDAQVEAMAAAEEFDEDTAELMAWFDTEVNDRGKRDLIA